MLPEQSHIDDSQRDESEFDVEVRVMCQLGEVDREQNRPANGVNPEAHPHDREKSLKRSKPHGRSKTENAEIKCPVDADDDTHSDGVKEKNSGEGKQRVGFSHPLAEAALLDPN